jgi:hypothetical protein
LKRRSFFHGAVGTSAIALVTSPAAFEVQAEQVCGTTLRSSKTMPPQAEDAEQNKQNAHEKR